MRKLFLLLALIPSIALAAIPQRFGDGIIFGQSILPKTDGLDVGSSTLKVDLWVGSINGVAASSAFLPAGGTTTTYLRGPSEWATLDTSAVPENGSLYFTNTRARAALSVGAALGYDATNGLITCLLASGASAGCLSAADWSTFNGKEPAISTGATTTYWRGDKSFQTLDTSAVPENSNQYFTNQRARDALSVASNGGITYSSGVFQLEDGSSTLVSGTDVDWSLRVKKNGQFYKKLTGNTTITFSNVSAGCIQFWVANSGSYTLTIPTAVKLPAGATAGSFTMTTGSKTDVLTFCSNGNTTIMTPLQNFDFN